MKVKLISGFIFVFLASGSYAQEAGEGGPVRLTLEECLDYALGNNYQRQSVQLNEAVQESSLNQSRLDRFPGISAGLSESVSNTRADGTAWSGNYDVSANLTLFQGGHISNSIRQGELLYEQAQLQTQQYDKELTVQVLQTFLTALGNEELLKYQEAILVTSQKQAEEGKIKFQAGQILESDYLLLDAQYATDLNNVTTTQINLNNNLVALKGLMGMDLLQPLELVYPDDTVLESMLILPTQQEVVERGMETLPDVKISDQNVRIAETGLKISRAGFFPSVSMSAGVGTGHMRNFDNFGTQLSDNFGPQAGVSVSIPIFNYSKARSAFSQSQIALKQAELERAQSLSDIRQTLINEYGTLMSSASLYKASEIRRNAYHSSFLAYTEMFGAGAITTVELLQQQNNYISAMNDYVQNKYTFMLQRKVLDVYMGRPVTM